MHVSTSARIQLLDCWRNRFAGRRMFFLPGGRWQVPAIECARQMGFTVICADGTPNAPGFAVADEGLFVSLQNHEALIEIGRTRQVDVVMTEQTDFAVPIVARIAAELGLRGLPVDVAQAATHKGLMRQRAARAGVRQPAFRVCQSLEEALRAARELGFPLFFKPADGQSSRGVSRLDAGSCDAIQAAFQRAVDSSRCGGAIVEQFVPGTECTVEGFVVDGCASVLAVSDKTHYNDLPGVARTLTWPGAFSPQTLNRIVRTHERTVAAIGIPFGMTHAEFLVDAQGEPWLVEIAARGGGTRIASHIVPAVCGFFPTSALIATLMGEPVAVQTAHTAAAQLRFLRVPAGKRIIGFPNLKELRSRAGVLEIDFNHAVGDRIPEIRDDRSRHGYVIVTADSRDAADTLGAQIERELTVETAD